MVDEKVIMPFNFFKYGGKYTGEHYGMRFRIVRQGEKPDFVFAASCWRGPLCYEQADKALMLNREFPFSESGRKEAIEWLLEEYKRHEEWKTPVPLTQLSVNLNEMYASKG